MSIHFHHAQKPIRISAFPSFFISFILWVLNYSCKTIQRHVTYWIQPLFCTVKLSEGQCFLHALLKSIPVWYKLTAYQQCSCTPKERVPEGRTTFLSQQDETRIVLIDQIKNRYQQDCEQFVLVSGRFNCQDNNWETCIHDSFTKFTGKCPESSCVSSTKEPSILGISDCQKEEKTLSYDTYISSIVNRSP